MRHLALVGSLVLFGGVVGVIGPRAVAAAAQGAEPAWVATALVLYLASLLVRVIKWHLLVRSLEGKFTDEQRTNSQAAEASGRSSTGDTAERGAEGVSARAEGSRRVSFGGLGVIFLAGSFLDATTPGARVGGEPLKAYYLSKLLGRPKSECLATVVVEKAANVAVLGLLALLCTTYVLTYVEVGDKLFLALAGLLALLLLGWGLALALWVSHRRAKGRRSRRQGEAGGPESSRISRMEEGSLTAGRTPRLLSGLVRRLWALRPLRRRLTARYGSAEGLEAYLQERVANFAGTLRGLGHARPVVYANAGLAALMWLLVFGRTFVLFVAFGTPLAFLTVATIVTITIMFSYTALTPGGLGVTEVLLLALYIAFGVASDVAAAVAVVDRLIYYGFGIGLGYWALRRLEKKTAGSFSRSRPPIGG